MKQKLRIGSVPYLNAKPMVDWFHTGECTVEAEIIYDVPSHLAAMLRRGELDVANVSLFEGLQNPSLIIVPHVSISADGAVKSVRLFSRVPLNEIKSVALDTSSLTSSALMRILLQEHLKVKAECIHHKPDIEEMLQICDAGLIIGDLKLFQLPANTIVYDLGQAWKELTDMPFMYAAWLAREESYSPELAAVLQAARNWGMQRLPELALLWSQRMNLPLDLCSDYLCNVMDYTLTAKHLKAAELYQRKCCEHGLLQSLIPIRMGAAPQI